VLKAGDLNRRVTIEAKTGGTDAWGQPLPDAWAPVCTVWASIKNLSGLGAIKADAAVSVVRTSIRVRWRQGLKAGLRVVHGATVYRIEAVLPDVQGREWVDLVCEVTQ